MMNYYMHMELIMIMKLKKLSFLRNQTKIMKKVEKMQKFQRIMF